LGHLSQHVFADEARQSVLSSEENSLREVEKTPAFAEAGFKFNKCQNTLYYK
jgi:hypothetical protein